MPPSKMPRISFAVLADAHKTTERGKVDCFGLFDRFDVWAVPSQRECSIVVALKDVLPGKIRLTFWLRGGVDQEGELASAELNVTAASHSIIFGTRLPLPLKVAGSHEVGVRVGASRSTKNAFWVPLLVQILPWPEPPAGEELARLLSDPQTIKSARAKVVCKECETEYVFEIHLDPNKKLSKGSHPFPLENELTCSKCGRVHFLKDIEGQVRSQLGRSASGAQP